MKRQSTKKLFSRDPSSEGSGKNFIRTLFFFLSAFLLAFTSSGYTDGKLYHGPNGDGAEAASEAGTNTNATSYRYLRLTALSGVSTYEVYTTEINWLVGSVAYPSTRTTSSSTNVTATKGQSRAWRAYDGVAELPSWKSGGTSFPYSITIDMGPEDAINPTGIQIAVQWQERTMAAFKCEGSNDNATWTTLFTESGLTSSDWTRDSFKTFEFSDNESPTAPTNLTASNTGQNTFTLSWDASSDNVGVASYEVFAGAESKGTTSSNSLNITGLDCNSTYAMTVKAKDAAGNESDASAALSVNTSPCGTANLLSNGEFNNGSTGWSSIFQNGGEGNFEVVTDANMSGTNAGKLSISDGGTANWNVELFSLFNLESGKTYEITFKAKAAANRSALVIFQKDSEPHTHYWEQNVALTTTTQDFGPFTWTSDISDVQTRLNFKVGNSNADIWLDAVVVKEVTTSGDTEAPSTPENLTASNISEDSFTLSWDASSDNVGVASYEVFAGAESKGTTSSNSLNITGLDCNSTYAMTVKAKDAAGNESDASAAKSVVTSNCSGTTYPNENSMLGMNLTRIRSWSREYYFTNLAHHSLAWMPLVSTDPAFNERIPDSELTNDRYLKPGNSGRLSILWSASTDRIAPGDYVFTYEGDADVAFSDKSTSEITLVSSNEGRIVINIPPLNKSIFVFFDVSNNSLSNPVKNIRFTEESRENATEIFRPEFVSEYEMLKNYRFMDWMRANHNTMTRWDEYPADNALLQGEGVSFNYMISLANQTNTDAWFCAPMLADDDFLKQMARKIRNNLKPELNAYIELSNEVWNGGFAAQKQAAEKARELGIANTGNNKHDAGSYYGYRSAQVENIFKEEFNKVSTKPNLIPLIAWQSADNWSFENMVMPGYKQVMGSNSAPEAVAIAPYFGGSIGSENNQSVVENWTVDMVFEQLINNTYADELTGSAITIERSINQMNTYKQVIDKYNVPKLLAYEGGQHLSAVGSASKNPSIINLLREANRDRQMYDVYIGYFDAWKEAGGDLFATFASTGSYSTSGSWGWKELPSHTREQAPKYDAILTWNSNNRVSATGSSLRRASSMEENINPFGKNILVYPNPAEHGSITVKFDKPSENKIKIYNMNGKVFVDETVDKESKTFSIEGFNSGLYFLQINGISQKMIVP